jgi:acetate kinase
MGARWGSRPCTIDVIALFMDKYPGHPLVGLFEPHFHDSLPEKARVISCHLGGSSSLCAIRDGKSIDTSFGFSLQSGILHSNRCGDIDAFMLPYLREKLGLSYEELFRELA